MLIPSDISKIGFGKIRVVKAKEHISEQVAIILAFKGMDLFRFQFCIVEKMKICGITIHEKQAMIY